VTEPSGIRDLRVLPDGLPVPRDDGAARHLEGLAVPHTRMESSTGRLVDLHVESLQHRVVVYGYPRTGRPGEDPLGGLAAWDRIPGARGCTPQAVGYAQAFGEFAAVGTTVYGLSTQTGEYHREAVDRLELPQEILSDRRLCLTTALGLPTFTVAGAVLLRRITLVLDRGRIVHVRYPVFPPDEDARATLAWLRATD
jgi:peroxiredoxin